MTLTFSGKPRTSSAIGSLKPLTRSALIFSLAIPLRGKVTASLASQRRKSAGGGAATRSR